jgi:uncharacterized protein YutE (UPF0331/DUF86 family)/predicted nucleotidyltransferase
MGSAAPDRERLRSRLARDLDARPEILLALLHGSSARGEAFRDVDVAVWLDPVRLSRDERFRFALGLSVDLRLTLGHPVDARVLNDAPLGFRYHALTGSPLVVRDDELLAELRARTWDEYFDFQPFARRFLREALSEINLDRLRALAGHVRDSVRQLRELEQSPREVFLADARSLNSAKYLLIVATEAALDICNHLAARRGARSPEDYADCMAIMGEIGVIDEDLKARMMRMARFRNLLVHLYARVDDAEVHRVIQVNLGDLERYLASVGQYLAAEI